MRIVIIGNGVAGIEAALTVHEREAGGSSLLAVAGAVVLAGPVLSLGIAIPDATIDTRTRSPKASNAPTNSPNCAMPSWCAIVATVNAPTTSSIPASLRAYSNW